MLTKDLVKLTDGQLDKVTAGAANVQLPFNTAVFADGGNGLSGVNRFSSPAEGNQPVQSVLEIRHDRVMIQKWDLSCGAAALATLLRYQFGEPVTEEEIARALMGRAEYVGHPELVQAREGFSFLEFALRANLSQRGSLYG